MANVLRITICWNNVKKNQAGSLGKSNRLYQSYRRSICVDYMYYNPGGTIQKIIQTKEGVLPVASQAAKETKKKNNTK